MKLLSIFVLALLCATTHASELDGRKVVVLKDLTLIKRDRVILVDGQSQTLVKLKENECKIIGTNFSAQNVTLKAGSEMIILSAGGTSVGWYKQPLTKTVTTQIRLQALDEEEKPVKEISDLTIFCSTVNTYKTHAAARKRIIPVGELLENYADLFRLQ